MRGRQSRSFQLAAADVAVLQRLARSWSRPFYQVQRARVVLAVAAGERIHTVAARLECDPATVWRLCRRYERDGVDGLLEAPHRAGRPLVMFPSTARLSGAVSVLRAHR